MEISIFLHYLMMALVFQNLHCQVVGRNRLSNIIPDMCEVAGSEGRKTGHSGKVTCDASLYQQDFGDQLIKEQSGHCSL